MHNLSWKFGTLLGKVECGRQECRRVAHAPQSTRVSEPFSVSCQVGNLAADEQRQVGLRDPPILQQWSDHPHPIKVH